MQIKLKVVKTTMTDTDVVVKLEPSMVDARTGDKISGELFLTTTHGNAVLVQGDEVLIDFTTEPEPIEG